MMPLQTALPLRGLAAAGYAEDPRAERAYEWLLDQRLDDGAWPVGIAHGQKGYIAGYRRLPGSPGCRANTTGALAALVVPSDAGDLGGGAGAARPPAPARDARRVVARLGGGAARRASSRRPASSRSTPASTWRSCSSSRRDAAPPATTHASTTSWTFLLGLRGENGLWQHPSHPELARWLTFDLLLSLRRLEGGDWIGLAPRTAFRAYPKRRRRY